MAFYIGNPNMLSHQKSFKYVDTSVVMLGQRLLW